MMKGLMDGCMSQAIAVDHVRTEAEASEAELREPKAWKVTMQKKFVLTKRLLEKAKGQTKALKKVLKDKKDEISESKKLIHQAKENAIKEYRDSDALLTKLEGSFADSFDDCHHHVKASFPNLDLSHVTINPKGQTLACLVDSKGTDKLFIDDANPNPQVNRDATQADQEKSVKEGIRHLEVDQTGEEKEEETSVA